MVQQSILLCPLPHEELVAQFQKVLKEEITKKNQETALERLLSPEETRKIFAPPVSKVTLHHWAKQGRLKQHRIGSRVFYKYSEVLDSLVQLKKYGR